jgi:predicted HD phosphohydrolase
VTLSVEQIVQVLESHGGTSYGGEAVTRLHADAKRYLCSTDEGA